MDLSELAKFLRENGDKVLNSESKLCLSTSILRTLNESFGRIIDERETFNTTFQVIGTSSSKIDLLIDLQFLHDFVQRAVSLKIILSNAESSQVDIRKFKNLKLLEVRKVPINLVIGLNFLRNQLQYLTCTHSVTSLKEVFVNCGGDNSDKYVWSELKEVNLSYNGLTYIDNSLEYVPWLQSLDLSHNKLVNVQSIDCLLNLKYLNLSYNKLEAVPLFNKELSRKLQILILKNNYIEDLTGLVLLDSLITLDLSCNCLVDHINLKTLPYLTSLQWLSLEGNPLFFHPKHRTLTSSRLHPNTSSVKFILDGLLLSKTEKLLIGTQASRVSRLPRSRNDSPRIYHESVSSNVSVNTFSSDLTAINTESLTRSQRKEKKIRDAIIADRADEVEDPMSASVSSIHSIETSIEHLETKKQIEILREKYGEKWLHNVGGELVQDVLGIPKVQLPVSSSPYEEDFKIYASGVTEKNNKRSLASSLDSGQYYDVNTAGVLQKNGQLQKPTNNTVISDFESSGQYFDAKTNDKADVVSDLSTNNTFMTASESSIYDGDKSSTISQVSAESEEEESDNDNVFVVQRKHKKGDLQELFLVVSKRYIKEQDTINARTINRWYNDQLIKCELISTNPSIISIKYNRQKIDMQNREYVVNDDKEAEQLLNHLKQIEKNNVSFRVLYECMKCCHRFEINSIVTKTNDEKTVCPSCNSTLITRVHVDNTKTDDSLKDEDTTFIADESFGSCQTARPETPSECSIGSAASVQESTNSTINSTDQLYDSGRLTKCESDIEVISNPSQSSIEVIHDDNSRSRKRSSEERRLNTLPTIHDVSLPPNILPLALTESSSSGSVTESVCTAYETSKTSQSKSDNGIEIGAIEEEEANIPTADTKTGLISSIFEGFFTGVKEGTKSLSKSIHENDSEIQFNISEDFSNVDHRVKFHLYQHIFEDEYEDFLWLLRCSLLRNGTSDVISACIVLSTQKIYTLQVKDHVSGEDIMGWLVKKDSYTIDRIQTVYALSWNQGIGIEIRGTSKNNTPINHLCILQDMKNTTNFFTFLTGNPLPETCNIVTTFPPQPMLNLQQALLSAENTESANKSTTVSLMSIFTKCKITNNSSNELSMGTLVITNTDLILIQDILWLLPDSKTVPNLRVSQPINNLLELEIEMANILEFHFLDEVKGYEEIWYLDCGTEENRNAIISSTQVPWEKIFSVPLQVSHKVHVA